MQDSRLLVFVKGDGAEGGNSKRAKGRFSAVLFFAFSRAHAAVDEKGHEQNPVNKTHKGVDPKECLGDIVAQKVHIGVESVQNKED